MINTSGLKELSGVSAIATSTLLSGGVIGHGSVQGYITDAVRRKMGMGLSELQDGQVHYFSKDTKILKRAIIQSTHQLAYGMLRSYPRYIKYWEQKERDKHLQNNSQTSLANKQGQYFQLISEQKAVAKKKNYADTIVGSVVTDFLEISISENGSFFDNETGKIEPNQTYGLATFVDLQAFVQVSSKNNIQLTTVQGRDYTRKEFISGGDFEITINGKITSKYPDVYPEAELAKFLKVVQYKGVIDCEHTILRQFNISKLIVLNYNLQSSDCRNVQPYTVSCVAVEPSEAVQLKLKGEETVDNAIAATNQWIKLTRMGTKIIDPSSLLKISRLWI